MSEKGYTQAYRIYKARKTADGVASQFDFNIKTKLLFLEMASQSQDKDDQGNALFNWKDKISFKLGISDIGEILCVLVGKQSGVGSMRDAKYKGLYHQSSGGDSVLYFEKGNNGGYYMKLSVRRDGKDRRQLEQLLTNSEGIILSTLLRNVVEAKYEWV